ncbi:BA14K family protein [Bosea sp. (in: a-proteobacteria)]|uniref:BA14K family protein n=1 Tax=Bosea sp. (in: a-proteobacteria) TaxID=1871050 RepID=UPI00261C4083|nr:BA14K family protein [Bosea sp. (in: a-proteobacteria)]MCO5093324.1 BA14K family protein [Bosea sp. (in: a-proteobacteria)]
MIRTLALAAALAGGAMLAQPAAAAPLAPAASALAAAQGGSDLVQNVQWRRYGYGPRYYGGYRRGPAVGAGIAAGIIGGALAAGALAAPPPPVYYEPAPVYVAPPVYAAPVPRAYGYSVQDTDAVAYCSSRFRTYNPETGTYIAKGGVVRACP